MPIVGSFDFKVNNDNRFADDGEHLYSHTVTYSMKGLTFGDHSYHVHNIGDVWSNDGTVRYRLTRPDGRWILEQNVKHDT